LFPVQPHEGEEDSDDSLSSEDNEDKTAEGKAVAVRQDTAADANSQTVAVTDVNPTVIVPIQESNAVAISTSQDKRQRDTAGSSDNANHQAVATTSNATGQQAKAEIPDSNTLIVTATGTNDDTAKHQSDELDDSSSTMSLDSTEGCSESTSQTFYSTVSSSCVTPEPTPGPVVTQKLQLPESAETQQVPLEVEAQASPMKPSDTFVSLSASENSSDGSIMSGSNLSLKDSEEDTKGKSKFSNFFHIKKKSRFQKT
jgi:hypothetical protein